MRVRVDIDAQDILDEIDIEDLLDDLGEKKLKAWMEKRRIKTDIFESRDHAITDLFSDLRRAIQIRDYEELIAIVDSYERPKWRTPEACERDFKKLVQS